MKEFVNSNVFYSTPLGLSCISFSYRTTCGYSYLIPSGLLLNNPEISQVFSLSNFDFICDMNPYITKQTQNESNMNNPERSSVETKNTNINPEGVECKSDTTVCSDIPYSSKSHTPNKSNLNFHASSPEIEKGKVNCFEKYKKLNSEEMLNKK